MMGVFPAYKCVLISVLGLPLWLLMWMFSRHFAATLVIGCGFAERWYHAGSISQRWGVSLSAARSVLYFPATLIILIVPLSSLLALRPLVGGFHVWRKVFPLAFLFKFSGAAVSMIRSVITAQVGHCVARFR